MNGRMARKLCQLELEQSSQAASLTLKDRTLLALFFLKDSCF